jgi:hypothetical protein
MELSFLLDIFVTNRAQLGSKNAVPAIWVAHDDSLVGNRSARELTTEVEPGGFEHVSNWSRFLHFCAEVICEGKFISVIYEN